MNAIATMYNPQDCPDEYDLLRKAGFRVDYKQPVQTDSSDVIRQLSGYPWIIASGEYFPRTVLEALKSAGLRLIVRLGVGYDRVDIRAAGELGIAVANTPGANANAVAEHTLMLTMAVARNAGLCNANMHSGRWATGVKSVDLSGCTVGLVGFGNIARIFARMIRPIAGRILACDPYPNRVAAADLHVELADLDAVLAHADVLSLHLPLTEESRNMFDLAMFHKLKPGAIFINTSRGEIVQEDALAAALADGTLLGAGLDVYQTEPLPAESPLRKLDNCFMTPHSASMSDDAFHRMTSAAIHTILKFAAGESLPNQVNKTC